MPNCFYTPGRRNAELMLLSRCLSRAFLKKQWLPEAISALLKQRKIKLFCKALKGVTVELRSGRCLTEAFQKYGSPFGTFFCRAISIGEMSADPATFFLRLSDHYEKNRQAMERIFSRLIFPLAILLGSMGAICALLAFTIPAAVQNTISASSGDNLSLVTKISLKLFTPKPALTPFFLITACLLFACTWFLSIRFQWFKYIIYALPLAGAVFRNMVLHRTAYELSFLLLSGVDVIAALKITADISGRANYWNRLLGFAKEFPENNASLATAFVPGAGLFPLTSLDGLSTHKPLNTGERLEKIAEFYEEEAISAITAATIVIVPVVILIAGLLGSGVLAALYLPMRNM